MLTPSSRNGFLTVPPGATVHTIPEPASNQKMIAGALTRWSSTDVPMFMTDELTVEDVHQGQIADCWFLAAAAAVIDKPFGTRLIKESMIDCGDGTCIVRLYDADRNPVYIRTSRTRSTLLGKKMGVTHTSKTGFWSTALEKAGACFRGEHREILDFDNPSLKHTEFGHASDAFRMLLGCEVERRDIPSGDLLWSGAAGRALEMYGALFIGWNSTPNKKEVLDYFFGGRVTQAEWEQKRHIAKGAYAQALHSRNPSMFKHGALSPAIVDGMQRYLDQNKPWMETEYSGSGAYSARALELFRTIETRLARCPIAFGTRQDIGRTERKGHSGGESMVKGLVGKHAYAVLGVFSENVMARRKFVRAANPWGSYGRAYNDADDSNAPKLSPKEIASGVFWMELGDLCRMISSLYIGSPVVNGEGAG